MNKETLKYITNLKLRQICFSRLSAGFILCSGVSCVAFGINDIIPATLAFGSFYCCGIAIDYGRVINAYVDIEEDVKKNKQKVKRY